MSFGQRMFGGKYGVTDNKQLSRPTFGNRFANSLIGAATLGFVDPNFSTELAGDLPTVSRPEINPVSGSLGIAGLGTLGSIASLAGLDVDDSIGTNINLGAPSVQTAGLNKGIPTATDTKRQILAKILQENASG